MIPRELEDLLETERALLRLYYPWWLRSFVSRGTAAITVGRRIYVRAVPDAGDFGRLIRHEIEHVRQINRLGVIRFYVRYGIEYLQNIRAGMNAHDAYRSISFEREAFAAEEAAGSPDV